MKQKSISLSKNSSKKINFDSLKSILVEDFKSLSNYLQKHPYLTGFQSIFFFIGLVLFYSLYKLGFIISIQTIANNLYSSTVATGAIPFNLVFSIIGTILVWFLILIFIYSTFQGLIFYALSDSKEKLSKYLFHFTKDSAKWLSIFLLLSFSHFLLSLIFILSEKNSPYDTKFGIIFNLLQLFILLFIGHGIISTHSIFSNPSNINVKITFKDILKKAFRFINFRATKYFIVYLIIINLIGYIFPSSSVISFIYFTIFISFGTICYYILSIRVFSVQREFSSQEVIPAPKVPLPNKVSKSNEKSSSNKRHKKK